VDPCAAISGIPIAPLPATARTKTLLFVKFLEAQLPASQDDVESARASGIAINRNATNR
jgi:hypothetical protein